MRNLLEIDFNLLLIIKNKGDILPFIMSNKGNYSIVNERLEKMTAMGYINRDDEVLITKDGEHYLTYLSRALNKKGLCRFLIPDFSRKVSQKKKEEVYIPLSFSEK
jgi:hypothetical protein